MQAPISRIRPAAAGPILLLFGDKNSKQIIDPSLQIYS
jgi:hypothetical protein